MNERFNTRPSLLLRASNQDDHKAFDEFVGYYRGFIEMVLVKMNVNIDDRKDLEQDLLLKLWKDLSKFDVNHERSNFRGWLSRVIKNVVLAFLNKNKRSSTAIDELSLLSVKSSDNELKEMIDAEWKAHIIKLAVDKVRTHFDGSAFKIFTLTLDGRSTEEIATELKLKENSVYVLRARVKSKFQHEIRNLRSLLEFEND